MDWIRRPLSPGQRTRVAGRLFFLFVQRALGRNLTSKHLYYHQRNKCLDEAMLRGSEDCSDADVNWVKE
jgi:hypothetical protein